MLKWGIEEALLAATDATHIEQIVTAEFQLDVPKSYSHEYAMLGIRIAQILGCQGLFQRKADRRVNVLVVGFASDVDRARTLYTSLALQCTLALASHSTHIPSYYTGTEKFNAKRSFITGFGRGVEEQLMRLRQTSVASAGHGAELVLVSRQAQITNWISTNLATTAGRGRRYGVGAALAGRAAGLRANIGQSVGNLGRRQIGG